MGSNSENFEGGQYFNPNREPINLTRDILICISVTFVSALPYLINGLNYLTVIHDNLDSLIVYFESMTSDNFFSVSPKSFIKDIMLNTIPRNNFPDALKINSILFFLLDSKVAFLINLVLHKFIAVLAFYLLARDYVFKNSNHYLIGSLALLYSLLPTFSIYGAGNLCGFLLITWATFKYLDTDRKSFLLIFLFLPFATSLIFFDLFALPVLLVMVWFFYTIDWYFIKKLFWPFLLFTIVVSIANSNTLVSFFFPADNFVSHRVEFVKDNFNAAESLKRTVHYFFYGFYHAPASPKYLAVLFIVFLTFKLWRARLSTFNRLMVGFLGIQIFFAFVYGFWFWQGLSSFKATFTFFNVLDLTRLAFLSQPLWYLILAFVVCDIVKEIKVPVSFILVSLIVLGQLFYIYLNNLEMKANVERALGMDYDKTSYSSFRDFYLTKTFAKVKSDFPDLLNYWTLTIGEHPAVSRFNGLKVLDFYSANYAVRYKHKFKIIITHELLKDKELSRYFNEYGSRCYAFTSEQFRSFDKKLQAPVSLAYNWDAFKSMGGRYVVSFYPIQNSELKLLKEYRVFENVSHNSLLLYEYN